MQSTGPGHRQRNGPSRRLTFRTAQTAINITGRLVHEAFRNDCNTIVRLFGVRNPRDFVVRQAAAARRGQLCGTVTLASYLRRLACTPARRDLEGRRFLFAPCCTPIRSDPSSSVSNSPFRKCILLNYERSLPTWPRKLSAGAREVRCCRCGRCHRSPCRLMPRSEATYSFGAESTTTDLV